MYSVEHEIGWSNLEQQVREVTLLQPRAGVAVLPYADATIALQEVEFSTVRPTSLYVLTQNLRTQNELARDLGKAGFDPLALQGGLVVTDGSTTFSMLPPIVEKTPDQGQYVLDGAHRTYRGWRAGRTTFWALHIEDIRKDCPSYAFPNEWEQVVEYDEVPAPEKKKLYRPNYRALYRDFSPLNGSRLRQPN